MNFDIVIIDAKNAEDFFSGFYNEAAVFQNGYKLRRMLDFRQAVPGDYLLLKIDGKPFVSLEIVRTNSRRLWENRMRTAKEFPAEFIQTQLPAAIKALVEYLQENRECILPALPLFFINDNHSPYFQIVQSVLEEKNYCRLYTLNEFCIQGALPAAAEPADDFKLLPFVDLPLDERYRLVSENDHNYLPALKTEQLYQDYIEAGEKTEILWLYLTIRGKTAGYLMVTQTNLITAPETQLFNYWLSPMLSPKEKEMAISLFLDYIRQINEQGKIERTLFSVKAEDLKSWEQQINYNQTLTIKNIYLES